MKTLFVIIYILSFSNAFPQYGNFCGKNFTIDDPHILYPVDEIDRMCQIYDICINAYSSNDKCFCYQQAELVIWRSKNVSMTTWRVFFKFVENLILSHNCSNIYNSVDLLSTYGLSNDISYNYLTFYPPHQGTYINLPLCQNYLSNIDYDPFIYYSNLTPDEYADFIIRHKNEPCSYLNRGFLVTDIRWCSNSLLNYIHRINVESNKILLLINSHRDCNSNVKLRLKLTFETDSSHEIKNKFYTIPWILIGLAIFVIISIILLIKRFRIKSLKDDSAIKTALLKI